MKLTLDLRPRKVTGKTKQDIIDSVRSVVFTSSSKTGNYYTDMRVGLGRINDNNAYLFNVEKHNKKTEQKKVKSKTSQYGKVTKSKVIREAHWVGYIYTIPVHVLESMKLSVKQGPRNFKVIKKK